MRLRSWHLVMQSEKPKQHLKTKTSFHQLALFNAIQFMYRRRRRFTFGELLAGDGFNPLLGLEFLLCFALSECLQKIRIWFLFALLISKGREEKSRAEREREREENKMHSYYE